MKMKTTMSRVAWIAILSLLLCVQSVSAEGKRITILLRNGQEVKGELLSAREKSLIVLKVNGVGDQELAEHPEYIAVVSQQEIQKVILKGKSNVLRGMGIGLLAGTFGGAVIGGIAGTDNTDPELNSITRPFGAMVLGTVGGLSGLLFGALIGGASSGKGEEINTEKLRDLFYLRQYARYQEIEPEFCKTFGQ
jgi:hypothetical protein